MANKRHEMLGFRRGMLEVIGEDFNYDEKLKGPRWLTQCDCGNILSLRATHLRSPDRREHCGCVIEDNPHFIDHTGEVHGPRTITGFYGYVQAKVVTRDPSKIKGSRKAHWKYTCECGHEGHTSITALRRGRNCPQCGSIYKSYKLNDPERLRHLYLLQHPEHLDYYKVGLAVNLNRRISAMPRGVKLISSVTAKTEKVEQAEQHILWETRYLKVDPGPEYKAQGGPSEWRFGEEAVRIWHEHASSAVA